MDINDGFESERECEATERDEAGLVSMVPLARDALLARIVQTYDII